MREEPHIEDGVCVCVCVGAKGIRICKGVHVRNVTSGMSSSLWLFAKKKILVCASDLARYTGHNRFSSHDETRTAFWSRNRNLGEHLNIEYKPRFESHTHRVLSDQLSMDDVESLRQACNLSVNTPVNTVSRVVHDEIVAPHTGSTVSIGDAMSAVKRATSCMTGMSSSGKRTLTAALQTDVPIVRGTVGETDILDDMQRKTGRKITNRNDRTFDKLMGHVLGGYPVILVGRIDGRSGDEIVEVKRRKNKLFDDVPEYEQVQMNAYMFLTDTTTAIHCQQFNDASEETKMSFDVDFWEEIRMKVLEFVRVECSSLEPFDNEKMEAFEIPPWRMRLSSQE